MTRSTIAEALAAHQEALMALPGVVGISEGQTAEGAPCLKLAVSGMTDELRARAPRTLEGYPVEVVVTGELGPA